MSHCRKVYDLPYMETHERENYHSLWITGCYYQLCDRTAEVFHEFSKQGTGLEAAQVRKGEAVKRHLWLSCLAQSLLQRAPTVALTSEQFAFAKGGQTFGQRCRTITREVFHSLIAFAQRLFAGGYPCEQVVEVLMPA